MSTRPLAAANHRPAVDLVLDEESSAAIGAERKGTYSRQPGDMLEAIANEAIHTLPGSHGA